MTKFGQLQKSITEFGQLQLQLFWAVIDQLQLSITRAFVNFN